MLDKLALMGQWRVSDTNSSRGSSGWHCTERIKDSDEMAVGHYIILLYTLLYYSKLH